MRNEIRPHTGNTLRCRGWRQEGILRMLENTIANGERPEDLIIYGSTGQAARDWRSYHAIVERLRKLGDDETLVVQSGKPVAVFRSYTTSPRVVLATCNLVPRWATHEEFERLRAEGLTIHGQYTAASWAYIGSQGIMQGTFEVFGACATRHFDGSLAGRVVLSGGLGGMGSAQPPAITMNGGVALIVEIDPSRIARRLESGHVDEAFDDLDTAWRRCRATAAAGEARAFALLGNAADVCEHFASARERPDCVTDQTSAHNLLHGYVPSGLTMDEARRLRADDPQSYRRRAGETAARHLRALLALRAEGVPCFEYGNDLRAAAQANGVENAFKLPGFVPLFLRPSFAHGRGPVRWVLLSGDPADQRAADDAARDLFPDDLLLQRWLGLAEKWAPIEGLPARTCWLGYGARAAMMLRMNEMVARGELCAPVAVTRDHLDSGASAWPRRETENMPDGSDAIGDWPYLNAMLNVAGGADLVAIHQNAGDIGGSISAGMTVILDGSDETAERVSRVFASDPGIGVVRHADAGVPEAVEFLAGSDIRAGFVD